jgi:tRNA U34 5-methylaminomethyl-2-thiouridine-forming methyltransferase MnmC
MASESYRLVQLPNGIWSVHSPADAETMHPGLGPGGEAEALYVRQLRIPERVQDSEGEFVIWDVGLGGAANALAAIRACRTLGVQLRIVSFDYTIEPLRFALRHVNELEYLRDYTHWLEALMAQSAVQFKDKELEVRWELRVGDFPEMIRRFTGAECPAQHAIFFDPFSPAKNPAMWTEELFASLFRATHPGVPCSLATYSRSTMVRAAMLLGGFFVGRGKSSGRKEETTIAANSLALLDEPLDTDWLKRAERSDSAEPLHGGTYSQAPLTSDTLARLRAHPQFCQP